MAAVFIQQEPLQRPRRIMRVIALPLVMMAMLLGWSLAPAAAHSVLVSSSPADGATLTAPPTAIELVFNEAISPGGLQVVARGPEGIVQLGTPSISGPQVTTPWPQEAPPGDYVVSYRVVSADGHPIDGSLTMSYTDSAEPGVTTDLGQSAMAPEPLAIDAVAAEATQASGFPWWIGVVAVVGGVGIGAGIAKAMRARSSGQG